MLERDHFLKILNAVFSEIEQSMLVPEPAMAALRARLASGYIDGITSKMRDEGTDAGSAAAFYLMCLALYTKAHPADAEGSYEWIDVVTVGAHFMKNPAAPTLAEATPAFIDGMNKIAEEDEGLNLHQPNPRVWD